MFIHWFSLYMFLNLYILHSTKCNIAQWYDKWDVLRGYFLNKLFVAILTSYILNVVYFFYNFLINNNNKDRKMIIMFVVCWCGYCLKRENEGIFLEQHHHRARDDASFFFQLIWIEFNQQVDSCYVSSSWHFHDYYWFMLLVTICLLVFFFYLDYKQMCLRSLCSWNGKLNWLKLQIYV